MGVRRETGAGVVCGEKGESVTIGERVQRWLANPVLAEWEEPAAWSDAVARSSHESLRELTRILALRAAPTAAALLALGFWWIGRIPGGTGPVPPSFQLLVAAPMIVGLVLPHLVVRMVAPRPGRRRRIQLRERGPTVELEGRPARTSRWGELDAFDFGVWQDVSLLKLRLRGTWLSRRLAPRRVMGFGLDSADAPERLRPILLERGLREEPLADPLPALPRAVEP
jgi:hypothetical protein